MSVFSLIKRGRQQAKEHSAKQAEKTKEEPPKETYRHVVSHAAIDALATAPSSWKHDDRPKIMEQNKRRSAMANSSAHMGGMPRVGSSLSYVSFPSVYATPVVPLPKNYSYSSIPSSWRDKMASTPGSLGTPDGSEYFSYSGSMKGKEREFLPPILAGTTTPMSNRGVSVSGSSGNSSSSEEELEIRNKSLKSNSHPHHPRSSHQGSSTSEQIHRLHPAHSRKNPEAAADRHYPPQAKSTFFTAPRPLNGRVLSMDMTIPPVPDLPEQYASLVSSKSTSGQLSSSSSATSTAGAVSTAPSSIASTPASSTAEEYISAEQISYAPPVPPLPAQQHESSEKRKASIDTVKRSDSTTQTQPRTQHQPQSPQKARRLSKSNPSKFTEMETPASSVESAVKMSVETVRPRRLSSIFSKTATTGDVNQDQQVAGSPTTEAAGVSRRRLSKTAQETTTKKRWSFRSSKPSKVTT
ncbi:hypothetical protein F5X99DRAFT_300971 [Biscogniauxia marginata]|nr:hypothetical protein F5X99DRAFT_300971 [Biscogniauxia marginata]